MGEGFELFLGKGLFVKESYFSSGLNYSNKISNDSIIVFAFVKICNIVGIGINYKNYTNSHIIIC